MNENEASYQNSPVYTMRSSNRRRFFFIFVLVIILVAAILAGLFMLGSSKKNSDAVTLSPTIAATETPLPTSSASAVLKDGVTGGVSPTVQIVAVDRMTNLDRSKLEIAVLNGSGTAGAAKGVSDYLVSVGYKIARVQNADVFTYTNITVLVKKSKSSYAGLLRKDLQANPSFASVSASISDDITNDAEVIVGK